MTREAPAGVPAQATEWLARIEDAGINASAPREQLWVDGWLVRRSPGKAKRARCIQPVAPGRLGIDDKLSQCLPLYAAAGLQLYVRITPFAQPPGLDRHLAALGMARIDDSLVMALPSLDGVDPDESAASSAGQDETRFENVDSAAFAEWVGAARGSSPGERAAHAERIVRAPVPHTAVVVRDGRGVVVSGGQVAIEGSLAGLYDIFTIDEARGRGHGERVCRHLLGTARRLGASAGYLQVDAANERAKGIYRRLGFHDAYSYHYRTPAS
ncbi:MAG TPA: GNAT family N-acetyltransferase [Caldimonas sp.]